MTEILRDYCGCEESFGHSYEASEAAMLGVYNDPYIRRGWIYIKLWIKDAVAIKQNAVDGLNVYICPDCAPKAEPVIRMVRGKKLSLFRKVVNWFRRAG